MPTIDALRELVERGKRSEPLLATRLEKAACIILLRSVTKNRDGWVFGSEDGLPSYRVQDSRCECSDYIRHREGPYCKHRLAVGLFTRLHNGNAKGIDGSKPTCRHCGKEPAPGRDSCARCDLYPAKVLVGKAETLTSARRRTEMEE